MSHQPVWPLPCSWAGEIRPDHFILISSLCWLLHRARTSLGRSFPTPTPPGFEACVFLLFAFSKNAVFIISTCYLPLLSQGAPLISAMLPQAPGLCPRVYFSQEWGGERFLHETPPGFSLKSWWFWFRAIVEVAGGHCAQLWLHWVPRHC